MASLDRSRWAVLSPYLDEGLDLPDAERAQWLDALRARDATLAAEPDTPPGAAGRSGQGRAGGPAIAVR